MDWKRIKAEYIAGGTSYRKLAEKYDVPFGTLRRVAEREEWTQKRAQVAQKTDTKMMEQISDDAAEKAVNIIEVADKLLDKIAAIVSALPLEELSSTQSMKHLSSALKDLKEIKGVKSDADMREQEARIAKLRKEAEKEDDTTHEIEIVFNAGPGEWNE